MRSSKAIRINKTSFSIILVILFMLLITPLQTYASNSNLGLQGINKGIIQVNNPDVGAIRVIKGNQQVDYILKDGDNVPLTFGEGEYHIYLLQSTGGTKFKHIGKEKVKIRGVISDLDLYTASHSVINWENTDAVKVAKESTKNSKNDYEKAEAIYNYVSQIEYTTKYMNDNYVPNLNEVIKRKAGVCYDYASLFAGLARSQGIPTKLIMGYRDGMEEYHAWNEVYINGEWRTVDVTYDVGMRNKVYRYQSEDVYKTTKVY